MDYTQYLGGTVKRNASGYITSASAVRDNFIATNVDESAQLTFGNVAAEDSFIDPAGPESSNKWEAAFLKEADNQRRQQHNPSLKIVSFSTKKRYITMMLLWNGVGFFEKG